MTQSKHTPGPWRVTGRMTKYVEASIGNGLVQEVCAVGPTEADNGYGEQQEANARLIAESPTMHDLLLKLQAVRSPRELHNLRCAVAEVLARIEGV